MTAMAPVRHLARRSSSICPDGRTYHRQGKPLAGL
jgi:hypothetical protein